MHYHFKQVNPILLYDYALTFFHQAFRIGYLYGLQLFVITNALVITIFVHESLCSGFLRKN